MPHPLTITIHNGGGGLPQIIVTAGNAIRIEAAIDITTPAGPERRWFASQPTHNGDVTLDTVDILDLDTTGIAHLQVSSYNRQTLAARRTMPLPLD